MNSQKVNISIIEGIKDEERKVGSLQWQFLSNSLSPKDLELIRKMGIDIYIETECIDERAASQTILTGKIRVEKNLPGGGFDFLTKEGIDEMLSLSSGNIILDPHRSCGWGGIRMKFYNEYQLPINKPLDGTTMYMKPGIKFQNGISYIKSLVKDAFGDNNFLNSIARSAKFQAFYSFSKDYDQALKYVFQDKDKMQYKDDVQEELFEIAFVFGKMKELKLLFEQEVKKLKLKNFSISLNPDMLFDQPHHHVARSAIFNLTNRKLVKDFATSHAFEPSFFCDIELDRFFDVLNVVVDIMEGGHSATSKADHEIFIICKQVDLEEVIAQIQKFKERGEELKTGKDFVIHLIEENENPKRKEELLWLVR